MFWNLRLNAIIEINYNNCYYIIENIFNIFKLAVRYNSKPSWFKKAFTYVLVLLVAIKSIAFAKPSAILNIFISLRFLISFKHEVILLNKVNIYARNDKYIKVFTNLIEKFFKL